MTREEFEFYLKGCDVTLDNGKEFYEQDDLVKCFEDMGAFEQPEYLSKIPEDYTYDTETEDFLVYRHKYTGKEIHIEKPVPTYSFEPCEDAISRKWLKNAIHNFYKGLIHTPTEEDIQAYIDVAPSVNPKPKTGHWIKVDDEEPIAYDCSECLAMVKRKYNYCPNCGCRMVDVPDIDVGKMEVEE